MGPQYQASKATPQLVAARKSPVLAHPPHRQVSLTVPCGATPNHKVEDEAETSLLPHNGKLISHKNKINVKLCFVALKKKTKSLLKV